MHYSFIQVDFAVQLAHRAIFTNAAQNCTAGSRTFVHAKIYDDFIARSVELTKKRIVGDPFDSSTKQGPQVRRHFFLIAKDLKFV
jgi:aldehyde dehydrogenase (NAD+)